MCGRLKSNEFAYKWETRDVSVMKPLKSLSIVTRKYQLLCSGNPPILLGQSFYEVFRIILRKYVVNDSKFTQVVYPFKKRFASWWWRWFEVFVTDFQDLH